MNLRSLTGENFAFAGQMPQLHWSGFHVLYDHTLSEERRAAMLCLLDRLLITPNEGHLPPIKRIELHATAAGGNLKGYIVLVLERMTKVFEYTVGDPEEANSDPKVAANYFGSPYLDRKYRQFLQDIVGKPIDPSALTPEQNRDVMTMFAEGFLYACNDVYSITKLGAAWLRAQREAKPG